MHPNIVAGPQWFLGTDFIIDTVSMIILFLVGFFSWKYYKFSRQNKKHLVMFYALATLGLSFLFKILAYIILYNTSFDIRILNVFGKTVYYMQMSNNMFAIFFLIYTFLTLAGFYMLYSVYNSQSTKNNIIIFYFLILVTLFSERTYTFLHITSLLFLIFIFYNLWSRYRKNKLMSTGILASGFGLVGVSKIFFLFTNVHTLLYVLGELIQLAGFISLLTAFALVYNNGKKKGKDSNN